MPKVPIGSFAMASVVTLITTCGGGGGTDLVADRNCDLGTAVDESQYELIIPPRAGYAVGARFVPGVGPVTGGLPSQSVDTAASLSRIACADTSRLGGRLTVGLAGVFDLDVGGRRDLARTLTIDSMQVIRVRNADSLDIRPGNRFVWEALRVVSFSMDRAATGEASVSGVAQKIRDVLGLEVRAGNASSSRVSVEGSDLFLGWRGVELGEFETTYDPADPVWVPADRDVANVDVGDYNVDAEADGDSVRFVVTTTPDRSWRFALHRSERRETRLLSSDGQRDGVVIDRLVLSELDLEPLVRGTGGLEGKLQIRRRTLPLMGYDIRPASP